MAVWQEPADISLGKGSGLVARGGEDCGANCLYALARLMGREVSLDDVRAALPGALGRGSSLQEIVSVADSFGLSLEARRLSDDEILSASVPYILHLDFSDDGGIGHYVVVHMTTPEGGISWIDGTSGQSIRTSLENCRSRLTGFAVVPRQTSRAELLLLGTPLAAFVVGLTWGIVTRRNRTA